MTKKFGFTLAEVLITLGIIGVVAAMTLPTLVSNYQKQAYVAKLKKTHSTLSQGFKKMLADEEVSLLTYTSVFQSIGNNKTCQAHGSNASNCNDFYNYLKKYFKIVDIAKLPSYNPVYLNKSSAGFQNGNVIKLADGTMIHSYDFTANSTGDGRPNSTVKRVGALWIDVNGTAKPNKVGRDIFIFEVVDNGYIHPYGSYPLAEIWNGATDGYYWKTTTNAAYDCKDNNSSWGRGCAGRVLEEGKMDY